MRGMGLANQRPREKKYGIRKCSPVGKINLR